MKARSLLVAAHIGATHWCAVSLAACLICVCSQVHAARQEPRPSTQETLRLGETLTRQIKGGESQTFEISLASGQYVRIDIEQHGGILLATLFDPSGNEVIQTDSPAGGHGPIYLSTIASTSGAYQLEIRSTNKWATAQSYDVVLKILRNQQTADLALIKAEKTFAEGRKYFRSNLPEDALKSYDLALSDWKALRKHRWQAVTQYARSEAYRNRDRKKSEEALNETLKILSLEMAPNDWRLKASALNDLGPIYGAVGKNEQALAVLNEALNLFISHQDRRGQASALGNLARLHGRAGDLSLSRELIERALALRRAENDKPGEINLLNSLGALSDQLGEPDKAVNYFQQALRGWESLDEIRPADRARVAAVLNNLATASDKLGDWDKAREFYDKALAEHNESDPNRAVTLDNKGELYASLGDFQKAKECFDEALKALAPAAQPDKDLRAGVLVHKGQLSIAEGNLTAALAYFERARSEQPNPPRMADVLSNLGAAFAAEGNLEKAMEAYESALEIQIKLRDGRGQALTLQKRGEAYASSLGRQTEALDDFNRALVFWKQIKDRRGEATSLNSIAVVEQKRGNLADALASSDESIKIIESLRTNISSRQLRTSYFAGRVNFYDLNIDLKMQLGKSGKQIEYFAKGFESSEKWRARVLIDALGEASASRFELNRTADPRLSALIDHRTSLLAQLGAKGRARTNLLSGNHKPEQVAAMDREIDEITEEVDELEARLRSESPRFAALIKPQPSSISEIQRQLDQDTLLLEYALGEKRSYVWVVSAGSIQAVELPGRIQVEAAANRLVTALTARSRHHENESPQQRLLRITKAEADYPEASAALSKMVIGPIASRLGRKRLVVVADGALQFVPFSALVIPNIEGMAQSKRSTGTVSDTLSRKSAHVPLISKYEIVTQPSASVLALQRRELANRKPAPLAVAILADPVFDANDERVTKARANGGDGGVAIQSPAPSLPLGVAPSNLAGSQTLSEALRSIGGKEISWLPFSRQEALAIMKVAPKGEIFAALDFKASRETATSPSLAQYRIVHVATHGVMDIEHPELSGIVLSMVDDKGNPVDGYLRLHEIYGLNLPAELVVLSACQTGVGKQVKGEGLIALTRGFMYAGARSVVASYWKVDDKATSELMAEFYRQMFVNKLKPAAALRMAQIRISQQKRWNSPHYWAGFFLQGEWN